MNEEHLRFCSSHEWAALLEEQVIPWVLEGVDLGSDVLEVGPGPGRTTEILRTMVLHLTSVEIDGGLARMLNGRMSGSNVEVLNADATRLPLGDGCFSGVVSLTMLHHVPSPDLQNTVFAEAARVLRPGGTFAGVDSIDSPEFRDLHHDDTCVPLAPDSLPARLRGAGFSDVRVDTNPFAVRFRARAGSPGRRERPQGRQR